MHLLLVSLICFMPYMSLRVHGQSQDLENLYQMNATWKMLPTLKNTKFFKGNVKDQSRLKLVKDPISGTDELVYSVSYPKGSYSPSGSKDTGGVHFYAEPFGDKNFGKAILTYELGVPYSFDWVQGGKLPGLFAGKPASGCSGGSESDGVKCFSTRLMWRKDGVGEVYDYMPNQGDGFCQEKLVTCNKEYGDSLGRNFRFSKGWNTIHMFVQVNDPDKKNGLVEVYLNRTKVFSMDSLQYRKSSKLGITSLMFSTFFGGSEPRFATPVDTFLYFKNIQFSVGDEIL
ncbi:hypothetical protein K7432_009205 [Basidiobolus ranarum]|uniref:Polysaccharide lyase 14 domain-containing protein n=1 Tax=Basidiobolus ranarum TaxID=34480 RepID=A0ABR2VXH5_9FUNG